MSSKSPDSEYKENNGKQENHWLITLTKKDSRLSELVAQVLVKVFTDKDIRREVSEQLQEQSEARRMEELVADVEEILKASLPAGQLLQGNSQVIFNSIKKPEARTVFMQHKIRNSGEVKKKNMSLAELVAHTVQVLQFFSGDISDADMETVVTLNTIKGSLKDVFGIRYNNHYLEGDAPNYQLDNSPFDNAINPDLLPVEDFVSLVQAQLKKDGLNSEYVRSEEEDPRSRLNSVLKIENGPYIVISLYSSRDAYDIRLHIENTDALKAKRAEIELANEKVAILEEIKPMDLKDRLLEHNPMAIENDNRIDLTTLVSIDTPEKVIAAIVESRGFDNLGYAQVGGDNSHVLLQEVHSFQLVAERSESGKVVLFAQELESELARRRAEVAEARAQEEKDYRAHVFNKIQNSCDNPIKLYLYEQLETIGPKTEPKYLNPEDRAEIMKAIYERLGILASYEAFFQNPSNIQVVKEGSGYALVVEGRAKSGATLVFSKKSHRTIDPHDIKKESVKFWYKRKEKPVESEV